MYCVKTFRKRNDVYELTNLLYCNTVYIYLKLMNLSKVYILEFVHYCVLISFIFVHIFVFICHTSTLRV